MKWLRTELTNGKAQFGVFNHLGSCIVTDITARAGFDFVLVDLEHGVGDRESLVAQVIALDNSSSAGLVRVATSDPTAIKRVLDLGVAGVVVPNVATAAEAERIAQASRYPPEGTRGVASLCRSGGFGYEFDSYCEKLANELIVVTQIESPEGVDNCERIARVAGIDVLFVGPLDLTVAMGIARQYEHPDYLAAVEKILKACADAGKVAGIHAQSVEQIPTLLEQGFLLITVGSDGQMLAREMRQLSQRVGQCRTA